MSQIESIISWFKARGGTATLGDIAKSGQSWVWEFNARKSDLRRTTRYDLRLTRGRRASDNAYQLVETEANGKQRLVA